MKRIVTYVHRYKRPIRMRKQAEAGTATGLIIVTAASRGRGPKPRAEREVDPEVKARIDAFFACMASVPNRGRSYVFHFRYQFSP